MLLWLTHWLSQYHHGFQVFQYLTLRAILATLTALAVFLFLGPKMISQLAKSQMGQTVRDDGPQSHLKKSGTPTMGGVLIVLTILVSMLLWANLANLKIWLFAFVMVGFAAIGWVDDYRKIVRKDPRGLRAKWKYFWQSMVGLCTALALYFLASTPAETTLLIPFFKHFVIPLGWFFVVFTYFVIVGTSNAVNLTDGLDGLAIMPTIMVAGALGVFAYLTGNVTFANYLMIPYVPGAGDLVIPVGALFGAGLGFLWFNTYPAQVFMGDVGALSLGAVLGYIAVVVRQELILVIMGGLFVIETVSVILQVASFKLTGKRIFKMAPLHHHFELKGWAEPKVIVRFWIITVVLVLCGLASLKIR